MVRLGVLRVEFDGLAVVDCGVFRISPGRQLAAAVVVRFGEIRLKTKRISRSLRRIFVLF